MPNLAILEVAMGERGIRLNSEQQQVVQHVDGPMLVVAGAGTGKTSVIAARIANLIRSAAAKPSEILAMTFTDKAAREMSSRVESLLRLTELETEIPTFHSFGEHLLRQYGVEIGLDPEYQVLSSAQQQVVLNNVIDGLGLEYYRPLGNPTGFLRGIVQFMSRLKDENILPQQFKSFIQAKKIDDLQEKLRLEELVKIYTAYQDYCSQNGLMDYGDLLCKTLLLLEARPSVLEHVQQQYRYVMVDEYQDTNFVQAQILELLCRKHHNLMVVGDDDQSIYQFRGANISNILRFTDVFADAKVVALVKNYRTGQRILDACYQLIGHNNPYRLEMTEKINKHLVATKVGKKPIGLSFGTYQAELDWLAQKIKQLHDQGVDYQDMAILLRKNNQASDIAHTLSRWAIPYQLAESKKLFELEEVQNLLYFVRWIADQGDSQALFGLLSSEIYELSQTDISAAAAGAARSHLSLAGYISNNPDSAPHAVVGQLLEYLSEAKELRAGELLYRYFERSGYLKKLYSQSASDNLAANKLQNIAAFFGFIRDYENVALDHNMYSLWTYLQQIVYSEGSIEVEQSPLDIDAVNILTVHRAKGLEFDHVFIPNLISRVFPAQRRSDMIRMPDGLFESSDEPSIDWHIHEERRLMYVAMTRAKSGLYLSWAQNHGGKMLRKPSGFIAEALGEEPALKSSTDQQPSEILSSFHTVERTEYDPLRNMIDGDGYLRLTVNQLVSFERSPADFWYFEVLSMPKGPFHSLVYGSAVHAALEVYYQGLLNGKKPLLKPMYAAFDAAWRSEGFVSLQHEKDRFRQGHKVIAQYYHDHKNVPETPLYVEKPFALKLEQQKVIISGRYDLILQNGEGIEIRDFKTGTVSNQKSADQKVRNSLQLYLYSLAWQQLNTKPIESLSLSFVENQIVASIAPPDAHKTTAKITKMIDQIRSGDFRNNLTMKGIKW